MKTSTKIFLLVLVWYVVITLFSFAVVIHAYSNQRIEEEDSFKINLSNFNDSTNYTEVHSLSLDFTMELNETKFLNWENES